MKIIRIILLVYIFLSIQVSNVSGINYYISNSGDDSNSGILENSPWKTIDKVNLSMSVFKGGDSILFKRGDTFTGQIHLSKSGTAASSIVIGAYGSGSRPVLSGAVVLKNWEVNSGSIYVAIVQSPVKNVFVDDKQMTLARYPNSGWLFTNSGNGNTGFHDDNLDQVNGYWNNAGIKIRSINWAYEIRKVLSYTDKNVTFDRALGYNLTANLGYYFDDVLSELDSANEWYFDAAAKKLYFYPPSGANPNEISVFESAFDYGIKTDWKISYLVIQDISFKMYALVGAWFGGECTNISVINCEFINCSTGIEIDGNPAFNILIDRNYFVNSNARAVYGYSLTSSIITDNIVRKTGLVPGYGADGVNGATGICIAGFPNYNTVTGNTIDSTGYIGIRCDGQYNTVKNNIVKNSMLTLSDGGAIYCWGTSTLNSKIQANYIENVVGNSESCPDLPSLPMGIYLDDNSSYITISDNTVVNANGYGIFIHNSNNNTITGNTTFNNAGGGISFAEDFGGGKKNNTISDNVFYCLNENQVPLTLSATNGISEWGTFQNNHYCNPYNPNVVKYRDPAYKTHYFGLDQWKSYSGQDKGSAGSSLRINRFKVTGSIGSELIDNGTFDSNIDSWGKWPLVNSIQWLASGGLDSGCLQFTLDLSDPNTTGILYTNNFSLEKDNYYQLGFSVIGTKYGSMSVSTISDNASNFSAYYPIEPLRNDYSAVFSVPVADSPFRFDFQIDSATASMNIDNVHLFKTTGVFEDPLKLSYLFSNSSNNTINYNLQQAVFYNLNGDKITGSVELKPWKSEVLIISSGEYTFVPDTQRSSELRFSPNPVSKGNELVVELNPQSLENHVIHIYDSVGRLVFSGKANPSETQIRIETENLSRGLFVICLVGSKIYSSGKLVVY